MFYDEERASVITDAFELCSLAHKNGNIDTRYSSRTDMTRKAELPGATYKKIYAGLLPYCTHNVSLSLTRIYGELCHTVSVNIDTVLDKDGEVRIDMIQTVRKYDFYALPKEEWISYLKLCALSFASQKNIDFVRMRIYYVLCTKQEENIKHFDYGYSVEELSEHFDSLLEKVAYRAVFAYNKVTAALPSAVDCAFPYSELRQG